MNKTTIIKISRPEGHIEDVDVSEKFPNGLTDGMFAQVKKATAAAGRGECLSYTSEYPPLTDEEKTMLERQNAEDALNDAIRRHDAKAAVAARGRLESLGGPVPGKAPNINQAALNRTLRLAD